MAAHKAQLPFPAGKARARRVPLALAGVLALPLALGACGTFTQTTHHGYILSQSALEQVPEGSSQDQVRFALGTPSTTATFGNEVWYYISQTEERTAFLAPEIVEQRVLAIYFNSDNLVTQIANYGLDDGRVVDFIGRTTPTTGAEVTLLRQIFSSAVGEVEEPGGGRRGGGGPGDRTDPTARR